MNINVKIGNQEVDVSTVCKEDADLCTSPYGFEFNDTCAAWSNDWQCNVFYLRHQQNYANDRLKARGHLFLNDVYDMLGVPRTKVGQVCGWIYDPEDPNRDNFVDFGIKIDYENNRFVLDPNVDGCILDILN